MEVTLIAATSIDSKLTRNYDPNIHAWISNEDQQHLREVVAEHDSIVFGRGVYEAMGGKFDLQPGKLRVVLTHEPEKYSSHAVEGQLEFMNESITRLVPLLESRGKRKLLIAGGHQIVTDFLKAGLVNEIYLTVEPRIFGTGDRLIDDTPLDIQLQLISSQTLNKLGTVLLHYKVAGLNE